MNLKNNSENRRLPLLINGSFAALTAALLSLMSAYWSFVLEPRLREEAGANAEILAQAQAPLLADILLSENVEQVDVLSALDELLLFTDPATKSPYFVGIKLEVDYDVVDAEQGSLELLRGKGKCARCFSAAIEVYSKQSFELLGVATFLISDAFFERLQRRAQ